MDIDGAKICVYNKKYILMNCRKATANAVRGDAIHKNIQIGRAHV